MHNTVERHIACIEYQVHRAGDCFDEQNVYPCLAAVAGLDKKKTEE